MAKNEKEEKRPWKDLGAVVCFDTDNKGVKRRDKQGREYSAGVGVITVGSQTVKVYVRCSPGGRAGTTVVSMSTPPEDAVS